MGGVGFCPYWHSQWHMQGISGASVQYGKSSSSLEELELKRCDNGELEWLIDVAAEPDPTSWEKFTKVWKYLVKLKTNKFEMIKLTGNRRIQKD